MDSLVMPASIFSQNTNPGAPHTIYTRHWHRLCIHRPQRCQKRPPNSRGRGTRGMHSCRACIEFAYLYLLAFPYRFFWHSLVFFPMCTSIRKLDTYLNLNKRNQIASSVALVIWSGLCTCQTQPTASFGRSCRIMLWHSAWLCIIGSETRLPCACLRTT